MLRNKLVRSDGSVIDSSVIISCEYTEEVNSSTNLSVGDATASELTVEMLATQDIQQGEVLTYYVIEDGVETKIGVFNAEKPTMATRTSMRFSAYDNIAKTEKMFSEWLREHQSLFPMTLMALVQHTCTHCGVTFASTAFPNSDLSVNAFYADNITCRQVLVWGSAIAGRFVRANANGGLEFAWYRDASNIIVKPNMSESRSALVLEDDGEGNVSIASTDIEVIDDGEGNVTLNTDKLAVLATETGVAIGSSKPVPYFRDALSYENYSTDLIERVQINHSEDDVGTIYPAENDGNCFTISENMILGGLDSTRLVQIASGLLTQLSGITYVPVSVTVPRTTSVRAGDIITVVNSKGVAFTTYVMKVAVAAGGTTLSATGDKSYGSNVAVSSEKYSNLTGKIMAISKTVDGLSVENKDLAGKVSTLEMTTEEFKTYVGNTFVTEDEFGKYQESVSTQFSQTETNFEMTFTKTKEALDEDIKDLQDKQNESSSYIRFEDGNIILGRSDSEIILVQKNDRISFVRNVADKPEVAYFADDILYVTDGQFTVQLGIGKFGFRPGANGNLSFKKVVT